MDTDDVPRRMRVRRATTHDADALGAIARGAYEGYLPRMAGQRPAPMEADYGAVARDAQTWVVDEDGAVVGFIVLVPGDGAWLLENVAVDPSRQGSGLGRLLVDLAERRARDAGATELVLYTHVSMVENQRFYARLGYRVTGRRLDEGLERVFFAKRLDGDEGT